MHDSWQSSFMSAGPDHAVLACLLEPESGYLCEGFWVRLTLQLVE